MNFLASILTSKKKLQIGITLLLLFILETRLTVRHYTHFLISLVCSGSWWFFLLGFEFWFIIFSCRISSFETVRVACYHVMFSDLTYAYACDGVKYTLRLRSVKRTKSEALIFSFFFLVLSFIFLSRIFLCLNFQKYIKYLIMAAVIAGIVAGIQPESCTG